MAGIITGAATGASGVTLLARILGNAGIPIVQADISSIAYTVRDLANATTVTSGSLTVSSVVTNALVDNDPRWTVDSAAFPGPDGRTGYNFVATIAASAFASLFDVAASTAPVPYKVTPHRVQVTVEFTPVSGQVFRQVFQVVPAPTW